MKKVWSDTVRAFGMRQMAVASLVVAFVMVAAAIPDEPSGDVVEGGDVVGQTLAKKPYWIATRNKRNSMRHTNGRVIAVALKFDDHQEINEINDLFNVKTVTALAYSQTQKKGSTEYYVSPKTTELTVTDREGEGAANEKTYRVRLTLENVADGIRVYLTGELVNRRPKSARGPKRGDPRIVLIGRFVNLQAGLTSGASSGKVPFNCDGVVTEDVLEEEDLDPSNPEPEYIP